MAHPVRSGIGLLLAVLVPMGASALLAIPGDGAAGSRFDPAIASGRGVLQRLVDAREAPGVSVGVAVDGRVVWTEGFGYADVEQRVAATKDTRFGLGSISKTLTMAAVMRLVDEGRLDLDAPVERYLKDFPHAGKGVTIRRLAVHQSGISDAFSSEHHRTTRHFAEVDEAYQEIKNGRLEFTPGTKTEYATGVFTIIARAMERAIGARYLDIMEQRLFAPIGARTMVPNNPRVAVPHRTGFYMPGEDGGFVPGPPFDPSHKLAGAGFLATAEDLARFGAALIGPSLLSERARAEMFRPVPLTDGTPAEFALGLRHSVEAGRTLLHQPGGGIGISSWLFLYPREQLVIAVLSNLPTAPVGGPTHRQLADGFLQALDSSSSLPSPAEGGLARAR